MPGSGNANDVVQTCLVADRRADCLHYTANDGYSGVVCVRLSPASKTVWTDFKTNLFLRYLFNIFTDS